MRIASVACGWRNEYSAWMRIDAIARFLRQKAHDVEIVHFVRKSGGVQDDLKDRYVGTPRLGIPILSYLALRDFDYDIVYGNTHEGTVASLPGRLSSKPVVFDMHDDILSGYILDKRDRDEKPLRRDLLFIGLVEKLNLSFSSLIACVSRRMIRHLASKGIGPKRMVYVPNGIDTAELKAVGRNTLREELKRLGGFGKVIGYAGRWNSWQGMPLLFDVIEKCDRRDVLFVLAGVDFGIKRENLICIPWLPRSRIWELYDICDAMILPRSNDEVNRLAGPTKFSEYCAMGKPVISTPIGDPSDYVRECGCGIVVDGFRPEDLVEGIDEFCSLTEEEVERMRANSHRLFVKEFQWPTIIDRLEERLLELVG